MRWNVKVIGNTSLLPAKIISIECLVACNRVNYVGGTEDCERFVSVANTLEPVANWLKMRWGSSVAGIALVSNNSAFVLTNHCN